MNATIEFGYFPRPLDFNVGFLSIETLPDIEEKIAGVMDSGLIHREWCYAPERSRIFDLPKTHVLRYPSSYGVNQAHFLVWMLGFIHGIRLTPSNMGFLDSTPIKSGRLNDISWAGDSAQRAVAVADAFGQKHASNPELMKGVTGIINSLFLGQSQTLLDFESFIYLYIALDGCYHVWEVMNGQPKPKPNHQARVSFLCKKFKRRVPDWAYNRKFPRNSRTVATKRNATLHEGLFFGEPLGFEIYGGRASASQRNVLLEMRGLICRFLFKLIGFKAPAYVQSDLGTRQKFGVRL